MPVIRRPGRPSGSAVISDESDTSVRRAQWLRTRQALGDAANRFARLLSSVVDADARAIGSWDIGDVAAHVYALSLLDSLWATQMPAPPALAPLFDRSGSVKMDTLGSYNDELVDWVKAQEPAALGEAVCESTRVLLDGTADAEPTDERVWVGGVRIPVSAVVSHLLSELLVHGYDIARAEGRFFEVGNEEAALVFDGFLLPVLRSPDLARFGGDRASGAAAVCAEMRVRGCEQVLVVVDQFGLTIRPPERWPADVRISARPAVMLLVMYRRLSPFLPAARGQVKVWGRRPWRLRRLMQALQLP